MSTSEESAFVGLMQVRAGEGPCVEEVTTGQTVTVEDTAAIGDRCPVFAKAIRDSHYLSVHAIPLRLRGHTTGSLNLFRDTEGALNDADAIAVRGLADVATIAVLQERNVRDESVVREQLQRTLDSRILIEQGFSPALTSSTWRVRTG